MADTSTSRGRSPSLPTPAGNNRRLDRATSYVTDLWFPANPELISKIRTTLKNDASEIDLDQLVADLEGDYSLFMLCLRRTLEMMRAESIPLPKVSSPTEILRAAGVARLKEIIGDENDFSRHFFDGMTDAQRDRMREAITSASTVQVLAPTANIDSGVGYFAALMRQLGHTLIAWNYPGVYQSALEASKNGRSFDDTIAETLGFSPAMLAMSLAHQWRLPAEIIMALEPGTDEYDPEAQDLELEVEAIGRSLTEICRVGEALARANDPENYPSARSDWEFARREVSARLGPKGLEHIREAIAENCQHYLVAMPSFFRGGSLLDPDGALERFERNQAIGRNGYLSRCKPHIQEALLGVYNDLNLGHSIQALLRRVAHQVFPACGFTGACVYTVDPTSLTLIPQLKVGNIRLRTLDAVTCQLHSTNDTVGLAYQSEQPIARPNQKAGETELAAIATTLGHSQRIGVVYAEVPQVVFKDSEHQHLTHSRRSALR